MTDMADKCTHKRTFVPYSEDENGSYERCIICGELLKIISQDEYERRINDESKNRQGF